MSRRLSCLALVLPLLAACSSPAPPAPPAPLDPAGCESAGQTIFTAPEHSYIAPKALAWHDGSLYFSLIDETGDSIAALPDTGGSAAKLVQNDWAEQLWVEGDHLTYAAQDRLMTLPFAGGPPSVLVDGKGTGPLVDTFVASQAADDASFFWAMPDAALRSDANAWTIFRGMRATGAVETFARLEADGMPKLGVVGDQLVAAVDLGEAWSMPLTGGAFQALPRSSGWMFLGFTDRGPAWNRVTVVGDTEMMSLVCTDAIAGTDGPFWSAAPQTFGGSNLRSAGDGWLVDGLEEFSDGVPRTALWSVDREGTTGARVGCFTSVHNEVQAVATSPSALFVVASDYTNGNSTWSIVKYPR